MNSKPDTPITKLHLMTMRSATLLPSKYIWNLKNNK